MRTNAVLLPVIYKLIVILNNDKLPGLCRPRTEEEIVEPYLNVNYGVLSAHWMERRGGKRNALWKMIVFI